MEGLALKPIARGYNIILNGMAVLAGVLIFSSFAMIVVDVTMRIVGLKPPLFTIPVVEYILLWFTMLAAPWLVRIKGHVFIDALARFLPSTARKIIAKLVYAVCTLAALIYSVHALGLLAVAVQNDVVDVRSVDMPQWTLFAPMPICLFFVAVEFARYLVGIDDMYAQSSTEREGV